MPRTTNPTYNRLMAELFRGSLVLGLIIGIAAHARKTPDQSYVLISSYLLFVAMVSFLVSSRINPDFLKSFSSVNQNSTFYEKVRFCLFVLAVASMICFTFMNGITILTLYLKSH